MITLKSESCDHSQNLYDSSCRRISTKLRSLSDKGLLSAINRINMKERKLKVSVLLYLAELERRKLYLPLGYSSLFEYCVVCLKYTKGTAFRRVKSVRAVTKYPETLDMLISGDLNITVLSKISDVLDESNHRDILKSIRGKSVREVEVLVSGHRPSRNIRDSVRPVSVMRRIRHSAGSTAGTEPGASGPCSNAGTEPRVSDTGSNAGTCSSEDQYVLEQKLKICFAVDPDFMRKVQKIKSLLSGKYPKGINFETLFRLIMEEFLERHDPERRSEKRKIRSRRSGSSSGRRSRDTKAPSRHIPSHTRDLVYKRDGGRCTFVSTNGRRCSCTWDLEIDHIVPYARGGDNSPGNLRLLCRRHNMMEAERAYGKDFIRNKVQNE